ncbi:39S ribosomal protein L34, mitochondrial [Glossina fuscipes]|uniref:Large ribosomal subunit protein bL34m n=1 Tax=Glossina fuscipes TaxID=7396 RepID=A0A9C5Z211_9MUSC|nr:39S ribosomal protein L34, mitochondrial [Glossina fuscipes]
MFTGILQKTFTVVSTLAFREAHVFNRAILKPKVRCHFPKPREVKRINVHGWDKRMSTPEGRRVLMRRILKGRHNISH